MKVLVVDDHQIVTLAVTNLLHGQGFEVVGDATTGILAIDGVRKLKPDLVILDVDIPQLDGLSVMKRLSCITPRPRILIFTGAKNARLPQRCLQDGASGYVSKEGTMGELLNACLAIKDGYTWFKADTIDSVREEDFSSDEDDAVKKLSPREMNVLRCLAAGLTNMKIAESLHISNKTVSTYKTRLQEKLKIESIVELAEFAKRHGLA
ncbi:two-component system response regulator EvgA [Pseudomonas sp. 3296]|uniref:response regulator transcription factor n=1 Tax=Pseudomonas sp. 3296 TaxID=2817753 RepID=UPI00285BC547|nr:response regulator transcription factor [Pseudomonas sp. 3296]MDR6915978.1 two-component system response regulator EvgA [Pseudomonas sp. 3296]